MRRRLRRWRGQDRWESRCRASAKLAAAFRQGSRKDRTLKGKKRRTVAARRSSRTLATATRPAARPLPVAGRMRGSAERRLDLLGGGKAALLQLGVAQRPFHGDFERTGPPLGEAHLGLRVAGPDDLPRIAGARFIASTATVFDFDPHRPSYPHFRHSMREGSPRRVKRRWTRGGRTRYLLECCKCEMRAPAACPCWRGATVNAEEDR